MAAESDTQESEVSVPATVVSKNVDHGKELSLCFAVKNTNKADVTLLIWDWTFDGDRYVYDTAQQKKAPATNVEIPEGADCVFISNPISAKDLDGKLRYRTCIKTASGYVYGELCEYSVIDYANQRLSEVETEGKDKPEEWVANRKELYNYIISYNSAAEIILGAGAEPGAPLSDILAEKWESRWDAVYSAIGEESTEAMKSLYAYYGTDWLNWIANLYDTETGAFYYANSARDYIGFSPDVESTAQILYLLKNTGLFSWYDGYWGDMLPESLRAKLLPWLKGLQSEDGYFYHPQWGTKIGAAAKGRHLDQALGLIEVLHGTPTYGNPLNSQSGVSGVSTVISSFMDTDAHKSTVVAVSSFPDYMQSEAAMKEYLDGLKKEYTDGGKFNSWGFGHVLSSERTQLEAAGIIGYVCEYLNEMQDTETGFWEPGATYNSLSGVIKIATVYSEAGRALPNAEKMVDSAINVILSDEKVTNMCYIYNPIGAFSSILSSMKKTDSTAAEAARQKFIAKLPAIIEKTIEKFEAFRKDDGSFSYLIGMSDANSQGLRISLGFDEGDVNATAVGIDYITGALFGIIGTKVVPFFNYEDYESFCYNINDAAPIVKQEYVFENIGFDGGKIPSNVKGSGKLELSVVDDPRTEGENVLKVVDSTASNGYVTVDATTTVAADDKFSFTVSMDMCFTSASDGYFSSLYLENSLRGSDGRTAYMLWFNKSGNKIQISDRSEEDNVTGPAFGSVDIGKWFNLRIEYYFVDTQHANIKIYIDNKCVYLSTNTYYTDYDKDNYGYKYVYNYVDKVVFNPWSSATCDVMIDNIDCEPSITKQYDASDYTK